jgi:hypothetical protein
MADPIRPDDEWTRLFRLLPAKPLRTILGDRPQDSPAPSWAEARAKAAHLLSDPGDDVLHPSLVAVLQSWTPEVAAEVKAAPMRPALVAAFSRCHEGLRSLPADPVDAAMAVDTFERELQDVFLACGDRTAEVVLFAGSRVTGRSHADREPTAEARCRAILLFLGKVAAQLAQTEE